MPGARFRAVLDKVEAALSRDEWEILGEGFKLANHPSLAVRVIESIEEAGDPVSELIGRYDKFVQRVVATRHKIAHEGHAGGRFTDVELVWAERSLALVMKLLLCRAVVGSPLEVGAWARRTPDWISLNRGENPLLKPREHA